MKNHIATEMKLILWGDSAQNSFLLWPTRQHWKWQIYKVWMILHIFQRKNKWYDRCQSLRLTHCSCIKFDSVTIILWPLQFEGPLLPKLKLNFCSVWCIIISRETTNFFPSFFVIATAGKENNGEFHYAKDVQEQHSAVFILVAQLVTMICMATSYKRQVRQKEKSTIKFIRLWNAKQQ